MIILARVDWIFRLFSNALGTFFYRFFLFRSFFLSHFMKRVRSGGGERGRESNEGVGGGGGGGAALLASSWFETDQIFPLEHLKMASANKRQELGNQQLRPLHHFKLMKLFCL